MGIQDAVKQAKLTSGGLFPIRGNEPSEYEEHLKPYYERRSRQFIQEKAKYASDFYTARVQGIHPDDFMAWGTYRLRLAEIVRASSAISRNFDDYKIVLFEDRRIQYIRPGGKVVAAGSTWLVTNPQNISGGGTGIVQRCNANWTYLDENGNICREPMVIENMVANASTPDAQNSVLVNRGYFNALIQYNAFTKTLNTNSRVILGKGAYHITGFPPMLLEFTEDPDSTRLLAFTLRYEEPNAAIDDLERQLAGGLRTGGNPLGIRVPGV